MQLKYKIVGLFVCVGLLLSQCTSQKAVVCEFPSNMAESVRMEYQKICEKGQILYSINCACCHTKKVGRKELIPDFTPNQLVGYELRVLNAQHESGIREENVTPEELGLISTFLMYKKKNGSK